MHEPAFRRVALLGVGLIGGSVAAAARASGCAAHVAGHAMGDDAAQALALGLIDSACESVADAIRNSTI